MVVATVAVLMNVALQALNCSQTFALLVRDILIILKDRSSLNDVSAAI